ncbi:MAG: UDP-N-acetylmuramoyl-L-alanine--D-glutamate ligase [Patescibacteria group bacterium]
MNPHVKPYLQKIKKKRIHVIGASGAEGAAIIEFLVDHALKNITAHDFQPDLPAFRKAFKQTHPTLAATDRVKILRKISSSPVKLCLKKDYLNNIEQAELIFLSQGWYLYPPNLPIIPNLIKKGSKISSLTKLYLDLIPGITIGVTGSKGKSTTTALIDAILHLAKKPVFTSGNIREIHQQLLPRIDQLTKKDIVVLEISNRQLTVDLGKSPHLAVITNILPDHIEEHGSYQQYRQIKQKIFQYQTKSDIIVLNYDNQITRHLAKNANSKVVFFSTKNTSKADVYIKKNVIFYQQKELFDIRDIQLPGQHNLANVLAAIAATMQLHVKPDIIHQAIKQFAGIPHRLEHVATINGVKYYDDLKSTIPLSTCRAIEYFASANIHLIVGGDHKNTKLGLLAKIINKFVTNLYTLPGTTTDELLNELKIINSQVKIHPYHDIKSLIKKVQHNARPHDIVLLSPAGAHFQEKYLENKYSFKKLIISPR